MSVQLRLPGGGSLAGLPADDPLINPTIQIALASITAFVVDLTAIAILFQALVNFAPRLPLWVCAGVTLTAALALNSAVFWALAADDFAQFVDFFAGSLLGSVVSGLLLTPLLAVYLHYIAPRLLHFTGLERRPVFALLFGTFAQVERRLAQREQQLDEVTRMYSSQLQDERARALRIQELVNEIVHDMRSPITGLNLRIDLIRRSIDPAQRDAHIAAMRLSVERLTQLAASAAELVRLEHTPEDVLMPHDLNALARTLVEQFRPLAEAKGLALYVEAADDPLPIMLNREAMERALGNLLENAVRYTRSGSIRVRVQRTGDCAVLTVSDTGIGIQPEMQKRIFDRYFRANREEQAAEGSGLGLAIAQRIIEAGHNGAITVESTPGAGTTFIVTLPLV
jgi:signal transduction histidine kinase